MITTQLTWRFDTMGAWDAAASIRDVDDLLEYRIAVCDDGTFCLNESSAELNVTKDTFLTLALAKEWCERKETALVSASRLTRDDLQRAMAEELTGGE